jgi:hypothetical protein
MASPSASRACSDEFVTLHGLLATFGEVESMGTSTREMQKPSPSDGAGFPTLLRTGKRGKTFNPLCFTKSGQEPGCSDAGWDQM